MRFSQLAIQTQRYDPANARSAGFALLVRASYLTREGQPLEMGQLVHENARKHWDKMASKFDPSPDLAKAFLFGLGIRVIPSITADEFYYPIASGDEEIMLCDTCGYASHRNLAGLRKEPPRVEVALPVEKVATPDCTTIESLATFLQVSKEKTAKALMYTRLSDKRFIFIVVRGDMQASEAKLRQRLGDLRPATGDEIIAAGAVAGYASPIGLREALVVVDDLIPRSANLIAGANLAGYHLKNVNYPRDFTADLVADVVLPRGGDLCPDCAAPLELRTASVLSSGSEIRFDELLLPLAESHHDEKGLTLPRSIAPFDVYLMHVPGKTIDTALEAENIYAQLKDAGIAVLFDDRDERAGVKFNDADLIGCPIRITVGERGLQNGAVEMKLRNATEIQAIPLGEIVAIIKQE
jgi:prolyl-tRNA synthetase